MRACSYLACRCLVSGLFLIGGLVLGAGPVLRRVTARTAAVPLLRNGDFEQVQDGNPVAWQAAPKGFRLAAAQGRNGSHALCCDNAPGQGWFGASQTLTLDRTNAAPLIIRGWSRAANVTGGADSDYSLYADLVYADGTTLWGQSASFRTGTHDWQLRQFMIFPEKPVRTLTLHCLFRNHAGQVWFDDVSLEEAAGGTNAVRFQGVAVEPAQPGWPAPRRGMKAVASGDGLRLSLADLEVNEARTRGGTFTGARVGGFLARDVAAGSDFFGFDRDRCAELGLELEAETVARSNHIVIEGRVSDTTGKDRAVTLVFAIPVDATGWTWGDDIRRQRRISGRGEFANLVSIRAGATGTESLYPVASVWDSRAGLALALDLGRPAVYRVGYHAGLRWLFIAYDFGLVKDTVRFPSGAEFRFVLYRFDPDRGGFRAAWRKYMEIFPDYFVVRSKEQGLWMPFTDVSRVNGWQDFGFRYHEGNNNVPWDDEHGILSFRYTEPMTWWMSMAKDIPRTVAEALRVRDDLERGGNENRRRMAGVTHVAAMYDESGEPALLFRDTPWANGAVWSLNPNPWLGRSRGLAAGGPRATGTTEGSPDRLPLNAATVYWNESIQERLYGPRATGRLDGEYLDSLEGYVTADLNFRREHFAATTVPLTFDTESKRPVLFKGLAVFEFTRWLAEDVHRLGKLMFANGVPYRFTYLCPWLDVLGTETDWLRAGKYQPAATATMDLWRSMCGAKPYLLLMNTDYDRFGPELVEKYFQRALFYGMWPGFFSHNAAENPYWQNPRWYERDRRLFRRYLPLIKRVAEAGWQPVSGARCGNEKILIERFGPDARGFSYLTLFNDSAIAQSGSVELDRGAWSRSARPEALLGDRPQRKGGGWQINLGAEQVAVWRLAK